jgi:hypothetical protein
VRAAAIGADANLGHRHEGYDKDDQSRYTKTGIFHFQWWFLGRQDAAGLLLFVMFIMMCISKT